MDQALKARLIGAAILVTLAVLVIPELLSGRKTAEPVATTTSPAGSSQSVRTYTIELGATPAQNRPADAATASEAATPPAGLPTPTDLNSNPAPGTAQTAATIEPPDATSAKAPAKIERNAPPASAGPVASTAPDADVDAAPRTAPAAQPAGDAAPPSKGTWSVQVGAFGSPDAARKLVSELDKAGYAAYVSPTTKSGKTLHRVRVGPESARASAESLAARLKSRGLPATIIAND